MGLYGDNVFTINENDSKSIIKKYEAGIKKFINKYSEEFFKQEKDKKGSAPKGYDWREVISKAPKVLKFEYEESDIPAIYLNYKGTNAGHDEILFYENDLVKFLNKQNDDLLKKFKFYTEDYPGILIQVKIDSVNEAVTEIKYGFSTGVKVQGKSIEIYKHKDRPTKDEIEALIPEIKKSAKLINDGWTQVINTSIKKYSECYNVTKEQAKKDLKYESISLMWSINKNPIKEADSFCAYFSSSAMDRDMHTMCVELDIINGKLKVTYAYIDG